MILGNLHIPGSLYPSHVFIRDWDIRHIQESHSFPHVSMFFMAQIVASTMVSIRLNDVTVHRLLNSTISLVSISGFSKLVALAL